MEYRITATIAEHGASDEWAERCLDDLLERHPEVGPVVCQNAESGHLIITVAVDATDPWAASNLAGQVIADTLNAVRLPPAPVLDVSVMLVEDEDQRVNEHDLVSA